MKEVWREREGGLEGGVERNDDADADDAFTKDEDDMRMMTRVLVIRRSRNLFRTEEEPDHLEAARRGEAAHHLGGGAPGCVISARCHSPFAFVVGPLGLVRWFRQSVPSFSFVHLVLSFGATFGFGASARV